jgi:hypothetical protein
MDNLMEDEERKPHRIKKTLSLYVETILAVWMAGIFLLNLLIFTPPIVWSIAERLNMTKQLTSLHNSAQQHFLTTDFSNESLISSQFWRSISNGQ